mgnify:CR=1 FL=1
MFRTLVYDKSDESLRAVMACELGYSEDLTIWNQMRLRTCSVQRSDRVYGYVHMIMPLLISMGWIKRLAQN